MHIKAKFKSTSKTRSIKERPDGFVSVQCPLSRDLCLLYGIQGVLTPGASPVLPCTGGWLAVAH